ncbi:FG-GAP-like repeat-containing protein [Algibacter sp. L1A34]|uniref:FG-GAP-like repeat-containing protein n=1 Tax=Algibacter sp. L1A34 TaxID=2686365 RepID=UPI00131D48E1|nr:FG-GAP-like repeat-containing protein [Algibacter sp. L1A34]
MKTQFISAILLFFSVAIFRAQETQCTAKPSQQHVKAWSNSNSVFNKRLKFVKNYSIETLKNVKKIEFQQNNFKLKELTLNKKINGGELFGSARSIPIAAHIVRRSDKTGGLSEADLQVSLTRTNVAYASLNMNFFVDAIYYIDSDQIFNKSYGYLDEIVGLSVNSRNIAKKLNVYFVPSSSTSWANFPSKDAKEQHILMNNSHVKNESTFAHELGHWFDLWHTHETAAGSELVNRSNCSSAGDQICDTPADPSLSGKVNSNCQYTGNNIDSNGETYTPNPKNMMSYAPKICRTEFTNEQIFRIQSAYLGMETDRGYTFDEASNGVIQSFGSSFATGDFNGDGFKDVAIGAKASENNEGRVIIYKGNANNFLVYDKTLDQQGLGKNEEGDQFGASLTAGDFNGDGKDDLAVGLPGESPGNSPKSGFVMTFKGSSNGLIPWQGIDQKGLGKNENGDQFGASLTAGDFNGDGKDDLAVGLPGESPDNSPKSGFVMTFKGSSTGLKPWQGIDQKGLGENENGDQFGASLTAGDFNGDGKDDLAVGLPGESPGNSPKSGYAMTFKGSNNGLSPWQGIDQKGLGKNEKGDLFGASMIAGDFNGDNKDDLVIGLPGEAPGQSPKSGYVMSFKGSTAGLIPWQGIDQTGLGQNENGDQFGASLTVGDFNGDGKDDLAVGLPGEAPGDSPKSGYVMIFKGNNSKLTPWQGIDQKGLGQNENGDLFGASLIGSDINNDNKCDLLVAAPNEKPGNSPIRSGFVFLFKGGVSNLSTVKGVNP